MPKWIAIAVSLNLVAACTTPTGEEMVRKAKVQRVHPAVETSWKPYGVYGIDPKDVPDEEFQAARTYWDKQAEISGGLPHFIYGTRPCLWGEVVGGNPLNTGTLTTSGVDRATWEAIIREKALEWLAAMEGLPTACPLDPYGNCAIPGGPVPNQVAIGGGKLKINVTSAAGRSYYYYYLPFPYIFRSWRYGIQLYQGSTLNDWDRYTMLHELGHAFGIKDTYIEGVWSCQPGHPSSVMCQYHDSLQPDDISAIRYAYCWNTKRCDPNAYLGPNDIGRCVDAYGTTYTCSGQ